MSRYGTQTLLCMWLCAMPQSALAQPIQIPAVRSVAAARTDMADGICATAFHVADPALGQIPFSSIDDALGVINQSSTRLTEDGRSSGLYALINFRNSDPIALGEMSGQVLFPFSDNPGANPPGNDRNFVMRLRGYINVDGSDPSGLSRTLGLYADDGARLRIGGITLTVPDVDERLNARRIKQVQYGASGLYPVEIIYYQNGSEAVLEFSESNQLIPENTKLTNLHGLGFTLVGEPRSSLFVNTELYTARNGSVATCIECNNDTTCPRGNYCVKDFGPTPPDGLCQACNVADHCGAECQACGAFAPICYAGSCVECLANSDCTGSRRCNQGSHRCEPLYPSWDYADGCSTVRHLPDARGRLLGITGLVLILFVLSRLPKRNRRHSSCLG